MKLRVHIVKDRIIDTDNPIFNKLEKEYELEKSGKKVEEGAIEEAVKAIEELMGLPTCDYDSDFKSEQEYIVAVWDEDTDEILLEF